MNMSSKLGVWKTGIALLLLSLAGGCDDEAKDAGDGGTNTTPTVLSNVPLNMATDVVINANASVTFSEAMDRDTLSATTFTLKAEAATEPVEGTVIYADSAAVFWPAAYLARDTKFTATVSTGAKSAAGVALDASHTWTFTTGDTVGPQTPVSLRTAGNFVILAKSGISTVPGSDVTGDIGVSPAAATFITGFSLTADATNVFATSDQVTGKVYAANYAVPNPSNMTTAISNMEIAFTDAAGRAPDSTELGAGDIGGETLAPGVYKWGTGLLIPTDVTLNGNATDVWIFQIAQDLTISNGKKVLLTGGALPQNIFWQVSGKVVVGTTAHIEGVVLSQTSITLDTGASSNGRLMAQTDVNIRSSTVTQPAE